MNFRFLPILLTLTAAGCNTFSEVSDAQVGSEDVGQPINVDAGPSDTQDADADTPQSDNTPVLLPEVMCPQPARPTTLSSGDFLTGSVTNISAVWSDRSDASTVSVGLRDENLAATVVDVAVPPSGADNSVDGTSDLRAVWALPSLNTLDLDLMSPQAQGEGPRVIAVSDPCEPDSQYGFEGLLLGTGQTELAVPCVDNLRPLAVEYAGGTSEFDSTSPTETVFVVAELQGDQVVIAVPSAGDVRSTLPDGPMTSDAFDLRGTSGEIALVFSQNAEAFVFSTTNGALIRLDDANGTPFNRIGIQLDIVHLSGNEYIVAYTDDMEIVLDRYHLVTEADDSGSTVTFENQGTIERVALDGPSIGVAVAAFRNGFAVLYFEDESTDHEWTMRPYTVSGNEFTPYNCDSDKSYPPIDIHSVDFIARRDGRDLVVQQANNFSVPPSDVRTVNVEGYVYPDFF